MSFLETPRFSDDVAAWAEGGAGYNTSIVLLNSGYEQRNVNWAQSRGRWDVASGLVQQKDVYQTLALFRAVKGRAHGFRFRDRNDYTDDGNGGFTLSSGLIFQMVKNYLPTGGALTEVRLIQKPVPGTIVVLRLGVPLSVGTGVNQYTLDTTTGLITLGAGSDTDPTHFTWTGQFDVPVRFDTDEMKGRRDPQSGFYEWNPIPVMEIRV